MKIMQSMEKQFARKLETSWRLINVLLFALAFYGPWGTIYGDTVYGSDMVWVSFGVARDWLSGADVTSFWAGVGLYYCFGLLCFVTYWCANMIRFFGKRPLKWRHWLSIPLIISIVFLLVDISPRIFLDNYNRFWWPNLYWGYWLLLLSFGSSLVLEIIWYVTSPAEQQISMGR